MKLHRFACFTAGSAYLLIIAGGLVTSTGSSLAVPDWPLSYGQFFPPMVGGIMFEHGHRMIAGTVAVLTAVLAVWVWRTERRVWVKRLALAAVAGIGLQAVLGGITVLYLLPHPVSIGHACLGQTVLCLLVAIAAATSASLRFEQTPPRRNAGWFAVAAIYIQLILGAVVRHTGAGVTFHIGWALAVAVLVFRAGYRTISVSASSSRVIYPIGILIGLLPIQMILGVLAYVARSKAYLPWTFWPVAFRTAHVATGAAILSLSVIWGMLGRSQVAAAELQAGVKASDPETAVA